MSFKCVLTPPPPTLPAGMLRPGRLIKLLKAQKASSHSLTPPTGTILKVGKKGKTDNGEYIVLTDDKGTSYTALLESLEALRLTKAEAAARKQRIKLDLVSEKIPPYRSQGVKLGTDPEVFVVDADGSVIPAFTFLPAKDKPAKFDGYCNPWRPGAYDKSYTAFWDGFQAEYTVPDSYCIAQLADEVRCGLKFVLKAARKVNPQARLSHLSVLDTPQDLLDVSPPEGVLLGCDPSYNAYFEGVNPQLEGIQPSRLPVRFAGFHVHVGCGLTTEKAAKPIVKAIDRIAGVASVAIFRGLENEVRRRYYGLAGEFRLPTHGLEYRVLSSVALNHPILVHLCFDLVRMGHAFGNQGYLHAWDATDAEVATAINELNVELALEMLNRNKPLLTSLLRSGYKAHTSLTVGGGSSAHRDRAVDKALRLIFEGAANLLNVTDLATNWKLDGSWETHSDRDRYSLANWKFE